MRKTILITNDDSINAAILPAMIEDLSQWGEVLVVVPKHEQSGKSHGIEIRNSFTYEQTEINGHPCWVVDSTPADCVRFAVLGLKKKVDLVISGINRGYNMGLDMLYSGTVAAAREAAIFGIPAVAISTSPENYEDGWFAMDSVLAFLTNYHLWDIHRLYNVNIPKHPIAMRLTVQGGPYYTDDFLLEDGIVTPKGRCVYEEDWDEALDMDAVSMGYISVTPITINMSDAQIRNALQEQYETIYVWKTEKEKEARAAMEAELAKQAAGFDD